MVFLVFFAGLFIGSFLNVCACRIPVEESVVFPPSRCPSCGRRLGAWELIPVLSFLWQRGRCRGCGVAVPWRYPAGELLTAVTFAVLYSRFGWPAFAWQALFYALLIVLVLIDLEHQIIPNRLVLLLLVLSVVLRLAEPAVSWRDGLLGMLLGGGLFFFLAVVSGGGMGGGDIKLVAVFGLWFGWQQLILLMFLSFLSGGLVSGVLLAAGIKKRKDGIPFGPFLVLAAFIVSMWGAQLVQWYLRLSGF
jgi:leader peptidase (prepilin peptidase) / N-methyltransferase